MSSAIEARPLAGEPKSKVKISPLVVKWHLPRGACFGYHPSHMRLPKRPGHRRSSLYGRAPEPSHQDSRYQGRTACHRGDDLFRNSCQRHSLIFERPLSGSGRGVSSGNRTGHRRWAQTQCRLGGFGFRQSLGRRRQGNAPRELSHKLGIAIAMRTYKAARDLLSSPRWYRIYNTGAYPQCLLWASTGTKDPTASDVLYVKALAAPFTVNTMPEATLNALANHKDLGSILPAGGGDSEEVLSRFADAGINIDSLAAQLQDEGAQSFVKSWNELMSVVDSTGVLLEKAAG